MNVSVMMKYIRLWVISNNIYGIECVAGASRGLQNLREARAVSAGFDSQAIPPLKRITALFISV